jgi:hypothetical protein
MQQYTLDFRKMWGVFRIAERLLAYLEAFYPCTGLVDSYIY